MASIGMLRSLPTPILITGHTGFKGAWLSQLLKALEIPYIGLALEPTKKSLYARLEKSIPVAEYFKDIRDYKSVEKIIKTHRPEVIIHLAAQPLVLESYKDPLGTFATNVIGTANILEAARMLESSVYIAAITTDKVYQNYGQKRKFLETDPILGTDPYSASKAGAENAIAAWRSFHSNENPIHISALRAGNMIGGGDYSDNRLLPDLIRAFQQGENPKIRNPNSVRPWQHVLDPLVGYLLALEDLIDTKVSKDFNFGPIDEALTVEDVARIACETWGEKRQLEVATSNFRPYEADYLDLSSGKANRELNWLPAWNQKAAIMDTVNWWKKNKSQSANSCCEKDLSFALEKHNLQ
jgi:CDP-glucose 4,6-dehydratase